MDAATLFKLIDVQTRIKYRTITFEFPKESDACYHVTIHPAPSERGARCVRAASGISPEDGLHLALSNQTERDIVKESTNERDSEDRIRALKRSINEQQAQLESEEARLIAIRGNTEELRNWQKTLKDMGPEEEK